MFSGFRSGFLSQPYNPSSSDHWKSLQRGILQMHTNCPADKRHQENSSVHPELLGCNKVVSLSGIFDYF